MAHEIVHMGLGVIVLQVVRGGVAVEPMRELMVLRLRTLGWSHLVGVGVRVRVGVGVRVRINVRVGVRAGARVGIGVGVRARVRVRARI